MKPLKCHVNYVPLVLRVIIRMFFQITSTHADEAKPKLLINIRVVATATEKTVGGFLKSLKIREIKTHLLSSINSVKRFCFCF